MTNAPWRPSREGEYAVFPSPHASGVLLVDKAVKNRYGNLVWQAVDHASPEYAREVARQRQKEGKCAT